MFFLSHFNSKTLQWVSSTRFSGGGAGVNHGRDPDVCVKTRMILMQMFVSSAERTGLCSSEAGATQATSGSALQGS